MPAANHDATVDLDWVRAHLDDPNVVFVHVGGERKEYEGGHLPGAVWADGYGDFTVDRAGIRALVPHRDEFEATLGRLGVDERRTVVLLASGKSMWPYRAYWVLRYFRFPSVHLVDGGIEALRAAGVPLTDQPTPPRTIDAVRLDDPDASIIVTYQDVLAAIDAGTEVILDCRSDEEFEGRGHGHAVAARLGRIPQIGRAHV